MKKFLIGCGITAGVLLLLFVGTSVYLVNKVQDEFAVSEKAESLREELRASGGEPGDFVPPAVFDPDRFARYVEIREDLWAFVVPRADEARFKIEKGGAQSDDGGLLGKIRGVSNMMRGGMSTVKIGIETMATRDSLLLAADMPEGEFLYYHCLAVYSWLEWVPPERTLDSKILDDEEWDEVVGESREELRDLYLKILANHAEALRNGTDLTAEETAHLQVLDQELEQRWKRTPAWPLQGKLPERARAELSPFEVQVRQTLPTNSLEYFIDTMGTHMESESHGGVQVKFDS